MTRTSNHRPSRKAWCSAVSSITLLLATPAAAWDGVKSGKLTGIDVVTHGPNYDFRIYMDGTPMCGTTENWAYLNKEVHNYDALVSLLTSSYLSGKSVTIYTTASGPYCEIGYAAFRG